MHGGAQRGQSRRAVQLLQVCRHHPQPPASLSVAPARLRLLRPQHSAPSHASVASVTPTQPPSSSCCRWQAVSPRQRRAASVDEAAASGAGVKRCSSGCTCSARPCVAAVKLPPAPPVSGVVGQGRQQGSAHCAAATMCAATSACRLAIRSSVVGLPSLAGGSAGSSPASTRQVKGAACATPAASPCCCRRCCCQRSICARALSSVATPAVLTARAPAGSAHGTASCPGCAWPPCCTPTASSPASRASCSPPAGAALPTRSAHRAGQSSASADSAAWRESHAAHMPRWLGVSAKQAVAHSCPGRHAAPAPTCSMQPCCAICQQGAQYVGGIEGQCSAGCSRTCIPQARAAQVQGGDACVRLQQQRRHQAGDAAAALQPQVRQPVQRPQQVGATAGRQLAAATEVQRPAEPRGWGPCSSRRGL